MCAKQIDSYSYGSLVWVDFTVFPTFSLRVSN